MTEIHLRRAGFVRGWAEYLGGTRVRFIWPCGHSRAKDYSKGPIVQRMGIGGVRFLSRYWGKQHGGVYLKPCPRCKP